MDRFSSVYFNTQIHTFTELCWTCEPDPIVVTNPAFLVRVYAWKPIGGVIAAKVGREVWLFSVFLLLLFSFWNVIDILLKKSTWSVGGGLSRDSLDLDCYWLRTDLTRVHVQKDTEELVVSTSWRVIVIKPPSLTFWSRRRNKKYYRSNVGLWRKMQFSRVCMFDDNRGMK